MNALPECPACGYPASNCDRNGDLTGRHMYTENGIGTECLTAAFRAGAEDEVAKSRVGEALRARVSALEAELARVTGDGERMREVLTFLRHHGERRNWKRSALDRLDRALAPEPSNER